MQSQDHIYPNTQLSILMCITIIRFHLDVTPTGIIARMTYLRPFGFTSLRGLDNKITIANRLDYFYAFHIKSPESPQKFSFIYV